jgi:undecaprenyl-diphosphatase
LLSVCPLILSAVNVLLMKSLIMGMIEGLTEFLPISSTGHLIIAGDLLNFLSKEQRGAFEIFIQLGAVLAICWEYRNKLIGVVRGLSSDTISRRFALNLMIAFIPSGIFGLALGKAIKGSLFSPVPVATALIIGGVFIIWAERRKHSVRVDTVDSMTWKDALAVGLAQCFALIPGTSRSGSSIIGGLLLGLSRKTATEFSFFLSIPTLTSAALYDLYKHRAAIDSDLTLSLIVGSLMSFVCALLAVRGLLKYISRHDFTVFAWYRIVFGILVLVTAYLHLVNWTN